MKIVCTSSLTLGREIFSAMGDVVHVLEEYIRSHNEADLTHGLCPDCTEKFWPTPHLSPGL